MKIHSYESLTMPGIAGYTMYLTRHEVDTWAEKWPCSTLRGRSLWLEVDSNGLVDTTAGEVDGVELDAIVADHLPETLRHLWPCWEG